MALAWNVVAQGEDITMIALPFWPLAGLSLGALSRFEPEKVAEPSRLWAAVTRPFEHWWKGPARGPVLAGVAALAFVAIVARPVAAEMLVQKSDEAADIDNPRSLQMMRWAERLTPMSADYHRRLSNAFLRNGAFGAALDEQNAVLEARRDFAPDEVRLGWLYWFGRDLDNAVLAFDRAVALDRWDTTRGDVHMALGLARAASGNYEGARDAFAYGLSLSPSTLRDDAWLTDQNVDPALTYIDPAYLQPVAQGLPGDLQRSILRRLGLPSRRTPVGPPSTVSDYSLSAVLDRMRADYEALLRTDVERAEALLGTMGQLALNAELADQAVSYYQELAQRTPDDEKGHYGLGLAYNAKGDNERAAKSFQRVLFLSESEDVYVVREAFSHFQLGLIALKQQPPDIPAARRALQEARDSYRWSYLPHLYPYLALAHALGDDTGGARSLLHKELYLLDSDAGERSGDSFPEPAEETTEPAVR